MWGLSVRNSRKNDTFSAFSEDMTVKIGLNRAPGKGMRKKIDIRTLETGLR